MQSIACLLVLVAASQAQWLGAWNNGLGYGWNNAGWNSGLYPYTGLRSALYNGLSYNGAVSPITYSGATPYYAAYAPSYTQSQYHSQDELGQASFGYSHPGQAAVNYRDAFGNQVGSYAYINPEGKEIRVSYTADSRGFRVLSNDLPVGPTADLALPVAVQDTPEVAEAKAAHLAAVAAVKSGEVIVPAPAVFAELPQPVEDTPEVAEAKKEHAKAMIAAKAAADAEPETRKKRQIILSALNTPLAYTALNAPLAYATPLAYAAPVVAAPAQPVREATLTKTVLNPGHAVSYRVD